MLDRELLIDTSESLVETAIDPRCFSLKALMDIVRRRIMASDSDQQVDIQIKNGPQLVTLANEKMQELKEMFFCDEDGRKAFFDELKDVLGGAEKMIIIQKADLSKAA